MAKYAKENGSIDEFILEDLRLLKKLSILAKNIDEVRQYVDDKDKSQSIYVNISEIVEDSATKINTIPKITISERMTKLSELAKKYKYFLFDCDGVLWRGSQPIGDAFRNIEKLEDQGAKVFFVTNLAATSRSALMRKMTSQTFSYKNAKPDLLYPASALAALRLKEMNCKKVIMLGMPLLKEELESQGIEVLDENHLIGDPVIDAEGDIDWETTIDQVEIDPEVGAVVQGLDYNMSYKKCAIAGLYLQKGAKWIITDEDPYDRTATGNRLPTNGCMVGFME